MLLDERQVLTIVAYWICVRSGEGVEGGKRGEGGSDFLPGVLNTRKIKPIVRHKFNLVICVDLNGPRMGTQGVDQRHGEKQQRECLGASTQSNTPPSQHGVNNQPEEDSTGPSKRHGADMMHNGNNREELTMLLDDIKTEGNDLKRADEYGSACYKKYSLR
ncbi:uncharacterized protein F5891DRAFT_981351 [Suillus fuscotomentosus]|uniref:Uncharacterized protein n=1 Tax=Suillus fuscotomentosus TaxID=1912939 RepID=A0AAD4E5N7_9AGAM|nr:uncharacterized protein F5891DRAFT_981351 [Suillus fuscotomentosus]KAG1898924.1 hypothetical protein F5891DRAFT_981351 [Suillus fuscotomentosus]